MSKVSVYNMEGAVVGEVELKAEIFDVEINQHLVHQAVVSQLANKRRGTQSAKTRAEVAGGGRKPWRQKGTGRARHGSIRAPQWTGGGVVFAPKPRDYSVKMNKKEKRAALKSVLASRVQENKFFVIDAIKCEEISTKIMVNLLKKLQAEKALVILNENDKNVILSARNIPNVKTARTETINVYDILKHEAVVIDKAALETIQEVYA
ncbi:MAG: 50S ribosomal protein L4 [Lachnospiraceae bacterium]|jgi:large subunit ribosomal protein L4